MFPQSASSTLHSSCLPNLCQAYDWASKQIVSDDARLEARLLLENAANCKHADLLASPETTLSAESWASLQKQVKRRKAGEPIAYLLARTNFYGLELKITPSVLIPRPETELLVDLALQYIGELPIEHPAILDLGTGSGAIAIALAKNHPESNVTAIDLSAEALALACENGICQNATNIRWLQSNWFDALSGERFHLVVSNPPYIADNDPHLATDGLPLEPQQSLRGGHDGLQAIRHIIAEAPQYLYPGGSLLLEHGFDQVDDCQAMFMQAGFEKLQKNVDLCHHWRYSSGTIMVGQQEILAAPGRK